MKRFLFLILAALLLVGPGLAPSQAIFVNSDIQSPTVTRRVTNLAGLKLLTGKSSIMAVSLKGRTTEGDGGEGEFRWIGGDQSALPGVLADTLEGVFVKPSSPGDGSTGVWVRYIDTGKLVSPGWFGAISDAIYTPGSDSMTGSDSSTAFQAAIDFIEATGHDGLFVPGAYFLATQVTGKGNWSIVGTSNPKMNNVDSFPKNFITGGAGIDSIFLLTGEVISGFPTSGVMGFEARNVAFNGYLGGPLAAIKVTAAGGPGRPFNIRSCYGRGFDDFLFVDISSSGLTTGIANLNITDSAFFNNTNTLRAKGQSAIGILRFVGNVSEQGGRILCEQNGSAGSLFGGFTITDNLLEGQSDPITIYGGSFNGLIARNYFESPSDIPDIKLFGLTRTSRVKVHNNFVDGNKPNIFAVGVELDEDETGMDEINVQNAFAGSKFKNMRLKPFFESFTGLSTSGAFVSSLVNDVKISSFDPNLSNLLNSGVSDIEPFGVSGFARTRFGAIKVKQRFAALTSEFTIPGIYIADANKMVAVSFLVRTLDTDPDSASLGFICRESASPNTILAAETTSITTRGHDFNLITVFVNLPGTTEAYPMTSIRFRLDASVTGVDIEHSDFYVSVYDADLGIFQHFPTSPNTVQMAAEPTSGTWAASDSVDNKARAVGQPLGWVCTASGTFSAATEAGATTSGSQDVTGLADTSDFFIGQLVDASAGFANLTALKIVDIVDNVSITVDRASNSSGAVTLFTTDPTWVALTNL